jgi:putative hemolysin
LETDTHLSGIFNSPGTILTSYIAIAIFICTAIVFLFALASLTGAEVAFFSLSASAKARMEKLSTQKSKILVRLLSNQEKLMASLVVASVFFKTGVFIVSVFVISLLIPQALISLWPVLLVGIPGTAVLILICESIPKTYASIKPEKYLLAFSSWIYLILRIFSPLSIVFYKVIRALNPKFPLQYSQISVDDLANAIEIASDSLPEEEDILKGIVKFGNINVSEILRPRIDVVAINSKISIRQVLAVVVESGYSRIPVYTESFDNVKGILYVKDLLPYIDEKNHFRWQSLIRPPYFVPETKKVKDLLTEFQTNKNHMAIVVDEYGGTLGIVTLEDILEEIVGEITDESDKDEKKYTQLNENTYIFDGKTLLNDFHKILQTVPSVFDEIKGDADTLAGLILEIKGVIPARNEQIMYKQFIFKIEAVDSRRIKQIRVILNN